MIQPSSSKRCVVPVLIRVERREPVDGYDLVQLYVLRIWKNIDVLPTKSPTRSSAKILPSRATDTSNVPTRKSASQAIKLPETAGLL